MKRLTLVLAVLLTATAVNAGEPTVKQTIEFVQKLQTSSGGFLSAPVKSGEKGDPSLRATSTAIRTLHLLNGKISDHDGCVRFIESCHDAESGGFADKPKAKPDVYTTAVGMMA